MKNKILQGDWVQFINDIPDQSIQLILIDPPYGTTPASWDCKIDMSLMWSHFRRIIKPNGAIVITSQQPFTSLLIASNIEMYKYNWIWEKDNGTNFLNSKFQPLKITEDICVFGYGATSFVKNGVTIKYNPQFTEGKPYSIKSGNQKSNSAVVRGGKGGREDVGGFETVSDGKRYPKNLIKFNRDKEKLHPTQKPVALMEYLIKTYTDENDTVLDCFAGSGTTGVACKNLFRNYILIEKESEYIEIIKGRLPIVDIDLDF
jgi:site-specific DNA-methyltransferase (adenine-specific)